MTFVERLTGRIRGWSGLPWRAACEAGAPIADRGGCHDRHCDSVRLSSLRPGDTAMVTCLEEPWTAASAKLAGLGILPGVRLRLVQRFPVYTFRLGRTELAVDRDLADRIRVRT